VTPNAPTPHLLDRAAPPVAVLVMLEPLDVSAALTRSSTGRQGGFIAIARVFMRLGGDRAVAHRTVEKRLTISPAASTSSKGTGGCTPSLI